MNRFEKMIAKRTTKQLHSLIQTFLLETKKDSVSVNCIYLKNAYNPATDEVGTYEYKFQIIAEDTLYNYEGWCYDNDLDKLAVGIYSHWLLKNWKIYDGPSTAWYHMYVGEANIDKKESGEC